MSWDEIRLRTTQEFSKRLDLLAHKVGHDFGRGEFPACATRPKFFFAQDELPGRVTLLKRYLPQEVVQIIEDADAICRHRLNLLGYKNVDYGAEIDWHLDVVHGKRAPLKPWYRINYLDFQEVGDHKVTWELNRHQHLVTLAKAWCLSGIARYVTELVSQWQNWRRANPYPIGINWSSSLEVGFRSLSWLWIAHLLDEAAPLPNDFRADLQHALLLNGRHIERYLSTYFSPNTHLLGEAVALFFIGLLCPQSPHAERRKNEGWNIILQAAKRQVCADGVYFEQTLHYHVYALDFFLHARTLASRNGVAIPTDFDTVIRKMLDVIKALSQASPAEGYGDDDGGRVFNPQRHRTEQMTDPLALGAALFGRESMQSAPALTEEAIWLFGEQAIETADTSTQRPIRSTAFETSGLYVIADASPCPQQMVVDAGPQGVGRCGHGHADALSVRMTVDGYRFLTDPGTYVYISDTNERDVFRGTGAHNTLRVDGQDQAVSDGPFAWTGIPTVKAERWVSGNSFDFLVASHDGYSRLVDAVIHRRFVFRGIDGVWLIRDVCEGSGLHLLETFWHFGDDTSVTAQNKAVLIAPTLNAENGAKSAVCLALLNAPSSVWQSEIGSGLVARAYGEKKPAAMARISASLQLPAEHAVLLVVQEPEKQLGEFFDVTVPESNNVSAYRYETASAIQLFFFARAAGSWRLGEWTSDAEFLYCILERGHLTHVAMVAGSFARWSGTIIVSHSRRVERFEWSIRSGNVRVSSSDDSIEHVLESDLESFDRAR